jgi:hypothetical protein
MHLPPPAQSNAGRSRAHLGVVLVAGLMNGLLLLALFDAAQPASWAALAALSLFLVAYSLICWWRGPVGILSWTGVQWSWRPRNASLPSGLQWALDFQSVVLVKLRPLQKAGPDHWIWLEQGAQSAASWAALRRALVAQALVDRPAAEEDRDLGQAIKFLWRYLIGRRVPQVRASRPHPRIDPGTGAFQDSTLR